MRTSLWLYLCSSWLVVAQLAAGQASVPSGPTVFGPPNPPAPFIAQPIPKSPALILNEVCFDQTGVDAQATLGSEYVELYARTKVQLGNFSLADNLGAILAPLPSVTVPAGSIVLIILGGGQNAYHPDIDLTDGLGAYMLGLPPADYLGNTEGGVRLMNSAGKIVDAVYWGTGSAPHGTAGGPWKQGTYFDISMSGRPMNEGDSIGRPAKPLEDYTGQLADWDSNGGVNAAGPTPKHRNGVNRANRDSLLKWVQAGVNQIVTGFGSQTQPGWFSFTDSFVSNVIVTQQQNSLIVVADHSFSIDEFGSPTTLAGQVTAEYTWSEAPGAVGYTLSAIGSLALPSGDSFSIDHSEIMSGFHTKAVSGTFSTDTVYLQTGVPYSFSVDSVTTLARTGQETWTRTNFRTCLDYGGAGLKTSDTVTTVTRQSDGAYSSTCTMNRDFPIAPPVPGSTDSILFVETKVIDTVSTTISDFGEFDTQITRYEVYLDSTLISALPSDQVGSASLRFSPASDAEPLGSASYQLNLPLEQGGFSFVLGGSLYASTALIGENIVYSSQQQIRVGGTLVESFAFSVDPPLPSQSAVGGNRDDADSEEASNDSGEGFCDAVANCAGVGAAIGAGAGGLVGGVAGGIGGAAVGTAVGTLGGPPGMVAAATAGGVGGVAAGGFVGAAAGGVAGGGIGAISCTVGWLWDKIF
jgi:hypothetical protein